MRLLNHAGRAVLQTGGRNPAGGQGLDVGIASGGTFGPAPQALFADWPAFAAWAAAALAEQPDPAATVTIDQAALGSPVPSPSQVFAVGLNYRSHAAETGLPAATGIPLTFTKFPSSITGPRSELVLTGASVDWEVELVVVIGQAGHRIPAAKAWDHIAGLTVGQDFSDRELQMAGSPPQFSLGKSFPGFGPLGPVLVTPEEFSDRNGLRLLCSVNGETVQEGNTAQMIHPVAELVSLLSGVCPFRPGDIIFTGTPDGVGMGRVPPRYLAPGDVVVSEIEGIGRIEQRCVAPQAGGAARGAAS